MGHLILHSREHYYQIITQYLMVTSLIPVNATSSGGAEIESVNSIKTFAPRLYSTQNRAVTASDYETIIPKIYPETESVTAFGGKI